MAQITISDLLNNPDFYLFGWENDEAIFLPMTRKSYANSIFFDDRIAPAQEHVIRVPLAQLLTAVSHITADVPRIGWIFHMAHTGSTLLARALDRPSKNLVIREPVTLRALGVEAGSLHRADEVSGYWVELLRLAMMMLGRRYGKDETVLVKANVPVNAIIADLLTKTPHPQALLLHFGLEDYLTAILRSPNHRKWVEHIYAEMELGRHPETGSSKELQNCEKAAALWLWQIRIYADTLAANPGVRSLDANFLFDEPLPCLKAATAYFRSPIDDGEAQHIISSELFSRYSKNPNAAFDNNRRRERVTETRSALADEFKKARNWVESRLVVSPLPPRLAQPLCNDNPLLL
jgi:hypothetical protein